MERVSKLALGSETPTQKVTGAHILLNPEDRDTSTHKYNFSFIASCATSCLYVNSTLTSTNTKVTTCRRSPSSSIHC